MFKCNPVKGCKYLDLGRVGDCNDVIGMTFSMKMFNFALQSGVFTGLKRLRFGDQFQIFVTHLKKNEIQVLLEWFSTLKDLEHLEVPQQDSFENHQDAAAATHSFSYLLYKTLLTHCTQLKSLKIGLNCVQSFGDLVFDSLEELHLDFFYPEENYDYLFKTIPNLKKLTMGYHMCYSNELFQSIATNCKKLVNLQFGERYLHESGNVPVIFNSMPQLTSLNFVDSTPYEEDLRKIAAECPNLVYFSMSDEYEGEGYTMKEFYEDMRMRLRNIDFNSLIDSITVYSDEEGDQNIDEEIDDADENGEMAEDREELDGESKRIEKTLHLINKKFPCIEILSFFFDNLPYTIQPMFEHLPNLKIIKVDILAEGCDKVFDDVEQDVKTRIEATNTLLKAIHGEKSTIPLCDHLIDDRITFTTIQTKREGLVKLKIKILQVNYDGFVSFQVKKL